MHHDRDWANHWQGRWISLLLSCVSVAWSDPARAESDLALNRLIVSAPADRFATVGGASLVDTAAVQVLNQYVRAPLWLELPDRAEGVPVVSDQWLLQLQGAWKVPGVPAQFQLDVPFALLNRGETAAGVPYAAPKPGALGSVRLAGRARVASDRSGSIAVEGAVGLPPATEGTYLGSEFGDYSLLIHLQFDLPTGVSALSAWGRRELHQPNSVLGSEVGGRLAYGLAVRDWFFALESVLAVSPDSARVSERAHVELLGSVRYEVSGFCIRLTAGPGFTDGPGTPAFRALAGAAYAFGPHRQVVPATSRNLAKSGHNAEGAVPEAQSAVRALGEPTPVPPAVIVARTGRPPSGSRQPAESANDRNCGGDESSAAALDQTDPCHAALTLTGGRIELQRDIQFDLGSDTVAESSIPTLADIAIFLVSHPEIARLAVEGHTDNLGSEAANLALSRRRAVAVVRWLVGAGVDARRLQVRAFGPRQPRADNATAEGQAANRRVEFTVVERSTLGERAWHEGQAPSAEAEPL